MSKIPAWAWIGLVILAAAWLWSSRRGTAGPDGPVTPGYTGTGDRTAQRPKARPWRG